MTDTFEPLPPAHGSPPSVGNAHNNTKDKRQWTNTLKTKTCAQSKAAAEAANLAKL
jgi:hypothetical protein